MAPLPAAMPRVADAVAAAAAAESALQRLVLSKPDCTRISHITQALQTLVRAALHQLFAWGASCLHTVSAQVFRTTVASKRAKAKASRLPGRSLLPCGGPCTHGRQRARASLRMQPSYREQR